MSRARPARIVVTLPDGNPVSRDLLIEPPLPLAVAALRVLDERRPAYDLDDRGVGRPHRLTQRPHDVDEEHHPGLVGLVPRLVLEGVVEHQAATFRPVRDLSPDLDPDALRRVG